MYYKCVRFCLIALLLCLSSFAWGEEVLYRLDAKGVADMSNARRWLEQQGFSFQMGRDHMQISIKDERIHFTAKDSISLTVKPFEPLFDADVIRITWQAVQLAEKGNYGKGMNREALGILVSFGTENIDSGAFWLRDIPYFIVFIYGVNEKPGQLYTGNYYKKGGRYVCLPCGVPAGENTITSTANIKTLFTQAFGNKAPKVSSIGFEIDVRDMSNSSLVVLDSIELIKK